MNRPASPSRRSRRGTMLVAFTFLIPAGMVLLGLLLSRIEVAYADTQRRQHKLQARLLAESALAVLRDQRRSLSEPIAGRTEKSIEGTGRYWIVPGEKTRVVVGGEVVMRAARYVCLMQVAEEGGAFRLRGVSVRVLPVAAPREIPAPVRTPAVLFPRPAAR